jgi:ADP-heptose:LPS heptosyltransferase
MRFFRADIASFAETAAGYLQPDMDRVMRYRQVLGAIAKSRKVIAINWRSLSKENGEQRSIPLEQLLSALPRDQYLLVNLQYGDVGAEIAEAEAAGYHLETLSDLNITQDLDGLVAAIAACDYQVSVDNTAVHLAGAIGVGQLVLLPFASNWRWGLGRNSCLFYQNTRLLSQSSMGDWSEPLLKLPALLESSVAAE